MSSYPLSSSPRPPPNFKFSERTFYILWNERKMCCSNRSSGVYPLVHKFSISKRFYGNVPYVQDSCNTSASFLALRTLKRPKRNPVNLYNYCNKWLYLKGNILYVSMEVFLTGPKFQAKIPSCSLVCVPGGVCIPFCRNSGCNFTKSKTPSWVLSRFLNCTNGTKLPKASQIMIVIIQTLSNVR